MVAKQFKMVKMPNNWVGNRFLFEDCALQLFAFGQLLELSGHIHKLQNKFCLTYMTRQLKDEMREYTSKRL